MNEKIDWQRGEVMAWTKRTEVMPVGSITLQNSGFRTDRKLELVQAYGKLNLDSKETNLAMGEVKFFAPWAGCYVGNAFNPESFPPDCVAPYAIEEMLEEELAGSGITLASAGTHSSGAVYYWSLTVPELVAFKVAGRDAKLYVNVSADILGQKSLAFGIHAFFQCCYNTETAAYADALEKVKRTKHSKPRVKGLVSHINDKVGVVAQWKAACDGLRDTPCDTGKAERLFAGFVAGSSEELTTRAKNRIDDLTGLFKTAPGNVGDNLYDVQAAWTYSERQTLDRTGKVAGDDDGRVALFETLKDSDRREAMAKRGDALLASYTPPKSDPMTRLTRLANRLGVTLPAAVAAN